MFNHSHVAMIAGNIKRGKIIIIFIFPVEVNGIPGGKICNQRHIPFLTGIIELFFERSHSKKKKNKKQKTKKERDKKGKRKGKGNKRKEKGKGKGKGKGRKERERKGEKEREGKEALV